jgi:hypothetical protein
MPIGNTVPVDWEQLLPGAPFSMTDTYNCHGPREYIEDACPNEII